MNRALPFTSKQALPSDSTEGRNRLVRHNRHKVRVGNIAVRSIHSQVRSSTAMQQRRLQRPKRRLQGRIRYRVRPNLRANHRPNELLRAIRSRRKWRRWLLLREQVFALLFSEFDAVSQFGIVLPVPRRASIELRLQENSTALRERPWHPSARAERDRLLRQARCYEIASHLTGAEMHNGHSPNQT